HRERGCGCERIEPSRHLLRVSEPELRHQIHDDPPSGCRPRCASSVMSPRLSPPGADGGRGGRHTGMCCTSERRSPWEAGRARDVQDPLYLWGSFWSSTACTSRWACSIAIRTG